MNHIKSIVMLGCAVGALALGTPARAQIALHDGTTAITTAAAATVTQSVTSTATSNSVLVVLVEDHNVYNAEPASLTWNGKTLTRAIQQDLNNGTYRGSAIYYCFNPPVGTANVSVTVTGANQTWISAFTLSGVDTNIPPEAVVPPLTGSDGENATTNILQFNVVGVKAGAWAVLNSTWANDGGGNPTITGTGGTDSHSYSDNNSTPVTSGYVSGLSAGTDNFQCQWFPGSTGNQKANFAGAIFSPFSAAGAAPLIIVQPQASVVAFTNVTVKFSVVERYGALPVSYQWYTNNTASALSDVGNLSGSASNVLTIANATLANAGGYTVVVTNLYGSVTSSVANLSIVTPNAYESAVLTNAPFAFYTFSETNDPSVGNVVAQDSMGYFSGTYGVASSNGFDGIAGPRAIPDGLVGFPNTNIALGTVVNLANSYVTLPAFNLNLNSGGGTNLTITAWIKPQGGQANGTAIVFSRSGATTAGLCYENVTNADGSYRLGFNWNNDGNAYGHDFGLTPPTNIWSLVALVVSPTNATVYILNTNGIQFSTFAYTNAIQTFAGPTLIGSDSFGTGRNFNGSIDEVALFGQPLSESQVVSLYSGASGVFGFAPVVTTQPLSLQVFTNTTPTLAVAGYGFPIAYQWYKVSGGVTNALVNATNASYTTVPMQNSDNGTGYFAVLSNQVGTATSTVAGITIITPPNAYDQAVLNDGPFAFYTFNETVDPEYGTAVAYDVIGGYNGIYGSGALNGYDSVLGPRNNDTTDHIIGFDNVNLGLETVPGNNGSWVPAPAFNFNNGAGANNFTFTSWIYPTGTATPQDGTAIVFNRYGSTCVGLCYSQNTAPNGQHALGYNWNNELATYQWNSGLFAPSNTWSMINLVITPTNTTIYILNTNGLGIATVAHVNVLQKFEGPTFIGCDPYSSGLPGYNNALYNRNYCGKIDEVALFSRGLSVNEMLALYTTATGVSAFPPAIAGSPVWSTNKIYAGMSSSITAPLAAGSAPLSYFWLSAVTNSGVYSVVANGASVLGATTATLTITNAQAANYRDYLLVVSNLAGSVTSSTPATLTVVPVGSATNVTLNYGGAPVQVAIGSDWNTLNIWNPDGMSATAIATIGHIGSTFEMVVGSALRNPAGTNYNVFPGTKLTVDGDGIFENGTVNGVSEFRFNNNAAGSLLTGGFYLTNYFSNLVLNGGQLNIGDNTSVVLQGKVTAAANSVLYAGGGASTNQTFEIDAYLTGSGTIQVFNLNYPSLDPVNSVVDITGMTNTFTGQWDVEQGALVGNGVNSLGSNTITINTSGILETTYPINDTNPNSWLALKGKMFLTQADTFNVLTINGTPLAAGTYTAAQLNSLAAANFPATFPALYGATATTASGQITVLTNSISVAIITQPASQSVFTNTPATFSVGATGIPINYQWYKVSGGVTNALANATNATYTTAPVQQSDSGTGFLVVVSNQNNTVTSSVASLLIATPNAYENAVLTNGPFAFYTFSETNDPSVGNVVAQDSMGYFSGTYGVASSNGFDGIAGPRAIPDGLVGFPNTNIALGTVVNLANSYVTLPAFNLNLNSGGGTNLTITAWIKPQGGQANGTAIVFSRSGATTAGLCYENVTNADGSYRLGFNWNNDGNAYGHDFGLTPPTNIWSLVALVVSPTNATVYILNTNGIQFSTFAYTNAIQTFAGPTLIGSDSFGTGRNFNGSIDEVALFGQPLSESQVVSLYSGASGVFGFPPVIATQPASQRVVTNTAATFSVAASGFPAIGYQWYKVSGGVTNALANATNATYTTAPVLNSDSGTGFLVVVSNQVNTVTSSTAILTAGHLVASSGYLIDNQYYGVANDISILYSIYPGSGWLAANAPSKTEYLNKFDDNEDLPTNSAQQIYGWFTPPVSGDYVFFMTADDAGTLWLSTNSSPANVYQIAQAQGYMIDRDWTCLNTACTEYVQNYATGEWRSDQFEAGNGYNAIAGSITTWSQYPSFNPGDNGIALVAGTKYYIELDTCQLAQYNAGQCAAVTYKLAGSSDPASNSPSLLMGTNISALVPDALMTPPHPVIGKITMSGSNMILSGSNGLLNAVYNVLSTTNVATPLTNWTVTATGVFNVSGNFSITNAIVPGMPQTFYLLQQKQ